MKIFDLNKTAWDDAVEDGENPYTYVVSPEKIQAAKQGEWSLYLSDCKPVPATWFPQLQKLKVLCLASGGGQQAPIFAALGAEVTLLDASPKQLAHDQFVAERDNLTIRLIEGDMADLSVFEERNFDLIFNPPSLMFVPELAPIWHECYRVFKPGGLLMMGFMNPDEFVFDEVAIDEKGVWEVKHTLPYIEHETLSQEMLEQRIQDKEMFHFSHTMETLLGACRRKKFWPQINTDFHRLGLKFEEILVNSLQIICEQDFSDSLLGGMLQTGFVITDFYEDRRTEEDANPIRHYMPTYYVFRAKKYPNQQI